MSQAIKCVDLPFILEVDFEPNLTTYVDLPFIVGLEFAAKLKTNDPACVNTCMYIIDYAYTKHTYMYVHHIVCVCHMYTYGNCFFLTPALFKS